MHVSAEPGQGGGRRRPPCGGDRRTRRHLQLTANAVKPPRPPQMQAAVMHGGAHLAVPDKDARACPIPRTLDFCGTHDAGKYAGRRRGGPMHLVLLASGAHQPGPPSLRRPPLLPSSALRLAALGRPRPAVAASAW